MRGTLTKPGSVWAARWSGTTVDGKRRARRKGGFATRREAQRYLTEQLQQSLSGRHLTALYRKLEKAGLSAATRRLTQAALSRALGDAVRSGELARNPAARLGTPARPLTRAKAWTPSEVSRFLEQVREDRLAALWRRAATTGMRRGELVGLTWRALDLDGARLEVSQQLLATQGGLSFGPPKSRRSRRTIALESETVVALGEHREVQLAAGIPAGSVHLLRHSAATAMLTHGVPVHIAAARLGDTATTILTTMPTCCHSQTRSPQSAWQQH